MSALFSFISAGFEGEFEGAIKLTVKASAGVKCELGAQYKDGSLEVIDVFEPYEKLERSISVHASANIMPYIKPALRGVVQGIVSMPSPKPKGRPSLRDASR